MKDVMPYVEKHYRTRTEANGRAICGLSRGGGQSLRIGLAHPDLFSYIVSFSGSVPRGADQASRMIPDPKSLNEKLHLLWLGVGRSDSLDAPNKTFEQSLTTLGVKHTWHETEGMHHWPIWRTYLQEVTPLLFQ